MKINEVLGKKLKKKISNIFKKKKEVDDYPWTEDDFRQLVRYKQAKLLDDE